MSTAHSPWYARKRRNRNVRSCLRTAGRRARHDRRWLHELDSNPAGSCHYDKRTCRVWYWPLDYEDHA